MESSEQPKGNESVNKEIEQKAKELAKATREQGMGQLDGKFPQIFLDQGRTTTGGQSAFGFIKGEEIPENDRAVLIIGRRTPYTLSQRREYENRQVWVVNHYVPPMEHTIVRGETTETKEKHFLGLRTKTIIKQGKLVKKETSNPMNYHGRKGESDWIQYDYYMPVDNIYDNKRGVVGRQNVYVNMSIAVPPDIAAQIDEQVEKNVYFPNVFFQALYPDLPVGTNIYDHLKRMPAAELEIADLRNVPDNLRRLYYDGNQGQKSLFKGVVRKYPQPIPY